MAYYIRPTSIDLQVKRLDSKSVPMKQKEILGELLAKIRHGTYNDFPDIENGLRHVAYKHTLKAIPTKLTLPEGIHFYTKEENNDIRCYLCSGNHLRRNCKLQPILSSLQDQEKVIHQNKPTEVVDFVTLANQPFTFPVYNTEQPVQSNN